MRTHLSQALLTQALGSKPGSANKLKSAAAMARERRSAPRAGA